MKLTSEIVRGALLRSQLNNTAQFEWRDIISILNSNYKSIYETMFTKGDQYYVKPIMTESGTIPLPSDFYKIASVQHRFGTQLTPVLRQPLGSGWSDQGYTIRNNNLTINNWNSQGEYLVEYLPVARTLTYPAPEINIVHPEGLNIKSADYRDGKVYILDEDDMILSYDTYTEQWTELGPSANDVSYIMVDPKGNIAQWTADSLIAVWDSKEERWIFQGKKVVLEDVSLYFDGTTYFELDHPAGFNSRVQCTYKNTNPNPASNTLFGTRLSASGGMFGFMANTGTTGTYRDDWRALQVAGGTNYYNEKVTIDKNRNVTTLQNEVLTHTQGSSWVNDSPLLIGDYGNAGTALNYRFIGNIYSFKFWDNDVLLYDLIPDEENGVWGFRNLVDNSFLTPMQGTVTPVYEEQKIDEWEPIDVNYCGGTLTIDFDNDILEFNGESLLNEDETIEHLIVSEPWIYLNNRTAFNVTSRMTYDPFIKNGRVNKFLVMGGNTDDTTGYGLVVKKDNGEVKLVGFTPDTQLDYPNNIFYDFLETSLAVELLTVNGADPSQQLAIANKYWDQFMLSLSRDTAQSFRIRNVRETGWW